MSKIRIHEHLLPNGLKIIGEINPDSKSVALGFFVKTGARDETPREAGVSHFLEHMMFKGTATRSTLDITYQMGNMAAKSNAYTSEENTVYYAAVLPEYFKDLRELLSDMLRPSLDPKEFSVEKKVILEEIALYKDRPHFYLFEHMLIDYFGTHPAGQSVLGSTDSISAVSRDEMKAYFDRRYVPSNMVVVATGNYNWDEFKSDIEKFCGEWRDHQAPRTLKKFEYKPVAKEYRKKDLNQVHMAMMIPGPGAVDEERFPMGVLTVILGDSVGSKLYWELINPGLADSADIDHDERDDTGSIMAYVSTEPDKLDIVRERLKGILANPMDFTDAELTRAKTKLLTHVVLSGESTMGRMRSLGHEWLARKRIHSLSEEAERIRKVTRADIEAALKKYPWKDWSEFKLLSA
jgi:predicted Zn-dependent peptidase